MNRRVYREKNDGKLRRHARGGIVLTAMVIALCLSGCGQKGEETPSEIMPEETSAASFVPAETTGTPEPSAAPVVTPEASPTPAPTPEPVANGYTVVIDPGHQQHANSGQEPIGPGAEETKPKVASGTQGVSTGTPEYQLTLTVSLRLEQELKQRGYNVVMVRTVNDVDISNKERADLAARAGGDVFIRVHANGSDDPGVSGTCTICPGAENPYMEESLIRQCRDLSERIADKVSAATGFRNLGAIAMDNMSGINWCTIPVSIVEMGFMTNPAEDEAMGTPECQQQIAAGIADGIDDYFAR